VSAKAGSISITSCGTPRLDTVFKTDEVEVEFISGMNKKIR
jgi:hypothetical protein